MSGDRLKQYLDPNIEIYCQYKEDIRQHNILFWRIPTLVVLVVQAIILLGYRFEIPHPVRSVILLIGSILALVLLVGLVSHLGERDDRQAKVRDIKEYWEDVSEYYIVDTGDHERNYPKVELPIFFLLLSISLFSFVLAMWEYYQIFDGFVSTIPIIISIFAIAFAYTAVVMYMLWKFLNIEFGLQISI